MIQAAKRGDTVVTTGGLIGRISKSVDENEVELLVGSGKLTAVHDKEKRSWTISQGNWESLLERKDFWRIDTCMPFTKVKSPTKPLAPTSTSVTAPAAQEPRQPVAR